MEINKERKTFAETIFQDSVAAAHMELTMLCMAAHLAYTAYMRVKL